MDEPILRVREYLSERATFRNTDRTIHVVHVARRCELTADDLTAILDEIARLRDELATMTAERDAAYAKSETVAFCHSDDRPRRDNMDWNEGYIDGCRGASYAIRAMKEDKT
jgi:hypothetical protein